MFGLSLGRMGNLGWRGKFASSSLNLNFVSSSQVLDPRITFTRASSATYFGSNGLLKTAPVNLLTYSEQFDAAPWGKTNSTVVANATVAPNGTTTADKVVDDASSATHRVAFGLTVSTAGIHTFSVYLKAAEISSAAVSLYTATEGERGANVNLATGTITSTFTSPTSVAITSAGNGWYRVSVSITLAAPTAITALVYLQGYLAYSGSGNGIFIWGAQLNVGSLQPYYPTTVKNLLGYTQEFDNAAWTKSDSFVQTNQIRNNTMQGAVAGTPGTLPTNWSYEGGGLGTLTQQVVGAGILNGINYVDLRISGTTSTTDLPLAFEARNTAAAVSGQTWTQSTFLAVVGGSVANITTIQLRQTGRTSAGAAAEQVVSGDLKGSLTASMTRVSFSATFANATTAFDQPQLQLLFSSGVAIDITLRIGMPQLVQGLTAGDVVATYGTARAVMYPAPDGSRTADKLVENTAGASHLALSTISFLSGTSYTYSIYGKEDATSAKRYLTLFLPGTAFSGANYWCSFDLATGAVINGSASIVGSATAMGNGWYRCSVQATANLTGSGGVQIRLQDAGNNVNNYTGDGTSGIYIWGAQLSDSASLDPYVYNPGAAPAASAYYGPRFDYDPVTLQPKGLLIEEQRTNLLTYSEQFDNAVWGKNNSTVTANAATAPDGTATADYMVRASTVASVTLQRTGLGITGVQTHTASIYAKAATAGNNLGLRLQGTFPSRADVVVNLLTGAVLFSAAVNFTLVGTAVSNAGNGWYRISITATSDSTGIDRFITGPTAVANGSWESSSAILSDAYIWGAQLEAGAFPTSYIPTTTAAATRAADVAVMQGANFSSWYRQDEGTLFTEASVGYAIPSSGFFPVVASLNDGTSNNRIENGFLTTNLGGFEVVAGGAFQAGMYPGSSASLRKLAGTYKINDFAVCVNGGSVSTDTSGTIPVVDRLRLGERNSTTNSPNFLNGYIRRIAYYPRRLSNSELQAITA